MMMMTRLDEQIDYHKSSLLSLVPPTLLVAPEFSLANKPSYLLLSIISLQV